jgi:hypothetical protein
MSKNCYPTLLRKKATLMGNFTRFHLTLVGIIYLILSWMKVSGLYALVINAVALLIIMTLERRLPKGFFLHLLEERRLSSMGIIQKLGK